MALCFRATRALHILPFPPRIRIQGLYAAQDLIVRSSLVSPTSSSLFRPGHNQRSFATDHGREQPAPIVCVEKNQAATTTAKPSLSESDQSQDDQPRLLYEGPFASLTLRLKRLSLMSAVIGIVGLPALSLFYGTGSIPATGQLAIITTAGVTAIGSTALLGYCFSPYVHYLERLPVDQQGNDSRIARNIKQPLFRITTRDILARRIETTFDPTTDISPRPSNNSRPFCNFMVKNMPMYVHPEMIHDQELRVQLVGEEPQQDAEATNKKKLDDDEFL